VSLDQFLEAVKKEQIPGGGNLTDARIDKNKNCVIVKTLVENQEKIKLHIVMVIFPGKDNMIQINCYSNQLDRDESDINFIINSFSYTDGYGYPSPITRFFKNININWEKGVAAGIIAFFSVWYAQVKRKKKKPYSPLIHKESQNNQKTSGVGNENEKGGEIYLYKIMVATLLFLICIFTTPLVKTGLTEIISSTSSFQAALIVGGMYFVFYFLLGAGITLNKSARKYPLILFRLDNPIGKIEDDRPVSFIQSVSKMEDFISACFYANIIQLVLLLIPSK
jgi:hypothetical protein